MKNNKKLTIFAIFTLLAFGGCTAGADYKTTLAAANQAINSLDNLGTREIELRYQDGGKLKLEGTVSSDDAKRRVEQAVLSVASVKSVENTLLVVPDPANVVMMPMQDKRLPNDQEIGAAVRQALNGSEGFDIAKVEYTVKNSLVNLTGSQNSFKAIDKILSVVLMVDGVSDVKSQMTVNGTAYPSFNR